MNGACSGAQRAQWSGLLQVYIFLLELKYQTTPNLTFKTQHWHKETKSPFFIHEEKFSLTAVEADGTNFPGPLFESRCAPCGSVQDNWAPEGGVVPM